MQSQTPSQLRVWLWRVAFVGAAAAGTALPGCGGSSGPDSADTSHQSAGATPTASIGAAVPDSPAPHQGPEPAAITPESLIREAKLLRVKPFNGVTSPEQIAKARIDRHKEIVRIATEVIAKLHGDPEKESLFDEAAFVLMDARLQLALCDDETTRSDNIDAIYEHAADFYKRKPDSKAAAEAAFTIAKFAHENARQHETHEWLIEFARQAELFATKFPREQARAASLLFSAGWSCESHGLTQPATKCYSIIIKDLPATPEAMAAAGSLRRLRLVGQPLQLGGSTLGGGYVSVDEYAGKTVLVLFWQAANPDVAELMPILADLKASRGDDLAIIGVALDEDEGAIESFLAAHPLDWTQIYFADPTRRGWRNTAAEFYGVRVVPTLWLVGPDGRVISTNLTAESARQAVASATP